MSKEHLEAIKIIDRDQEGAKFTADTFLDFIRSSNNRWHQNIPIAGDHNNFPMYISESEWVFRGLWNGDKWKLIPSALRKDNKKITERVKIEFKELQLNGLKIDQISYGNTWMNTESSLLKSFSEALEEYGYPIPDLSNLSHYFGLGSRHKGRVEITSLAQHHGIPTRFLDWSTNPLFAAYFSVANQFRFGESKNICIWALNMTSPIIYKGDMTASLTTFQEAESILIHQQPRHKNEYLRSQKGLFTEYIIEEGSQYFDKNEFWPGLEEIVTKKYTKMEHKELIKSSSPTLIKLILDASESDRLLQLLNREGINRSLLMPTLDNLVLDVLDKWNEKRAR